MTLETSQASTDEFIVTHHIPVRLRHRPLQTGLSDSERELVNDGTPVHFRAARLSHPTRPRGTSWRLANPGRYGTRFSPRVPEPDIVATYRIEM